MGGTPVPLYELKKRDFANVIKIMSGVFCSNFSFSRCHKVKPSKCQNDDVSSKLQNWSRTAIQDDLQI